MLTRPTRLRDFEKVKQVLKAETFHQFFTTLRTIRKNVFRFQYKGRGYCAEKLNSTGIGPPQKVWVSDNSYYNLTLRHI